MSRTKYLILEIKSTSNLLQQESEKLLTRSNVRSLHKYSVVYSILLYLMLISIIMLNIINYKIALTKPHIKFTLGILSTYTCMSLQFTVGIRSKLNELCLLNYLKVTKENLQQPRIKFINLKGESSLYEFLKHQHKVYIQFYRKYQYFGKYLSYLSLFLINATVILLILVTFVIFKILLDREFSSMDWEYNGLISWVLTVVCSIYLWMDYLEKTKIIVKCLFFLWKNFHYFPLQSEEIISYLFKYPISRLTYSESLQVC